jgi:CheY-like chemotaxis protein
MRVLVAEDENDISQMYKLALESHKHEVVLTSDGEECLRVYRKYLSYLGDQQKEEKEKDDDAAADHGDNIKSVGAKNTIKKSGVTASNESYSDDASISNEVGSSISTSLYDSPPAPFDVVILDYRMPKKNGLEVAKQILELVPRQRIVFASAYVRETLESSVKELNQVVELLQKPFDPSVLMDTIEDREPYEGIKNLMINIKQVKDLDNPSEEDLKDLFDNLRKIQKGRIS